MFFLGVNLGSCWENLDFLGGPGLRAAQRGLLRKRARHAFAVFALRLSVELSPVEASHVSKRAH